MDPEQYRSGGMAVGWVTVLALVCGTGLAIADPGVGVGDIAFIAVVANLALALSVVVVALFVRPVESLRPVANRVLTRALLIAQGFITRAGEK